MKTLERIQVIDSHTGGEPTRVVIDGLPDLGTGSMDRRLERMRDRHDDLRTALVCEPRSSEIVVGAVLCKPVDPTAAAGVFYFNNVGYLGMCGHGTIGLMVTLAHLGWIQPGQHRIETPVGPVVATLHSADRVSVENVPSYREHHQVAVDVPGLGLVRGDVAWGGNWFFLVSDHDQRLELDNVERLTDVCWRIREALWRDSITGRNGGVIDHIELFSPVSDGTADAKNFVLCPGKAYDRSPCGTGTSAKVACLAADQRLSEGDIWRQQSITGSLFEARYRKQPSDVIPTITGTAYVTGEATVIIDSRDPFGYGLHPGAAASKPAGSMLENDAEGQ